MPGIESDLNLEKFLKYGIEAYPSLVERWPTCHYFEPRFKRVLEYAQSNGFIENGSRIVDITKLPVSSSHPWIKDSEQGQDRIIIVKNPDHINELISNSEVGQYNGLTMIGGLMFALRPWNGLFYINRPVLNEYQKSLADHYQKLILDYT